MKKNPAVIDIEKETRSFFSVMTVILAGLAIWILVTTPELHNPGPFILFNLIMAIHIFLHWMLRRFSEKKYWTIVYVFIQSGLAVLLIYLCKNIGLVLGVSLALVGEAIGVHGVTRKGIFTAFWYLAVSFGCFIWISGWDYIFWWMVATVPMLLFVVIYVELYSHQIRANQKAQFLLVELESTNRQLSDSIAQVEDLTIAAERQRMARELHDTLSQGLAGMILQLEAADANLANGKPEISRQIIQRTMQSARLTLSDARLAIGNLRRTSENDQIGEINQMIRRFSEESGIPCTTDIHLESDLASNILETVQGLISEALTNIHRHAKPTCVTISTQCSANDLLIEIGDDGLGFDPASVPSTGHYGLVGMHERLQLINGSLSIDSHPGGGTKIQARIPHK